MKKDDLLPIFVCSHTQPKHSAHLRRNRKVKSGDTLHQSGLIRAADTACLFCNHLEKKKRGGKRVMWDWRLKYFINQCWGQCVVLWLVENSGNPSFSTRNWPLRIPLRCSPCYSLLSWFPGLTCVVGVGAVERATCTMPSPVISVSVTCMLPL